MSKIKREITIVNSLIQVYIFVLEIALKYIVRESNKCFFSSGWNLFDILIVGSAFVPAVSGASTVLRILRVLRVFRLVRAVPELRLMVTVLARSLKSMGYIGLLLGGFFYIYAILGVELFNDFKEYATLKEAFYTLFRSLTLEDWTDLRYAQVEKMGYWLPTIYHVSWVVVSAVLMVNLVVGAILNNYQIVIDEEKERVFGEDNACDEYIGSYSLSDERIHELVEELRTIVVRRSLPG